MTFDFDQHKRELAQEYAALVRKHADFPAIGDYIRLRVSYFAEREPYADFPELFTHALKAQQEHPSDL